MSPFDFSALSNPIFGSVDAGAHLVDGDTVYAQFISDPLAVQKLIAQTVTTIIQGTETSSLNELFLQIWLGLVSFDGTTPIATLLAKTRSATEMVAGGTETARLVTGTTTEYVMTPADYRARLVLEVALGGTPTGSGRHNGAIRIGGSGVGGWLTDGSTSTTQNPYFDMAQNIRFADYPNNALNGMSGLFGGGNLNAF